MYADSEYYFYDYGGEILTPDRTGKALQKASDLIDTLTFNRIASLEGLTAFQRGIVKRVCCALADWLEENRDAMESPYASYSINGVSMSVGSTIGVKEVDGVLIPCRLYNELCKTGLCYRGLSRTVI